MGRVRARHFQVHDARNRGESVDVPQLSGRVCGLLRVRGLLFAKLRGDAHQTFQRWTLGGSAGLVPSVEVSWGKIGDAVAKVGVELDGGWLCTENAAKQCGVYGVFRGNCYDVDDAWVS